MTKDIDKSRFKRKEANRKTKVRFKIFDKGEDFFIRDILVITKNNKRKVAVLEGVIESQEEEVEGITRFSRTEDKNIEAKESCPILVKGL